MDLTTLTVRVADRTKTEAIATFERGSLTTRSTKTLCDDVAVAVKALSNWGIRPGMRVGIHAANCYQWLVFDLALIDIRAISVAFTDDFADEAICDLVERYSLSLLLLSATDKRRNQLDESAPIAYIDGENISVRIRKSEPLPLDDSFSCPGLIFSSGSSGGIKGLVLSRQGIEEVARAFVERLDLRSDDSLLIFLPLSNFQQRLMCYAALWYGCALILTEPKRLFHALSECSPTIVIAPPLLFETIEVRVSNLPAWKQFVLKSVGGFLSALPLHSVGCVIGRFVFSEVHKVFGGKIRLLITGMAPIKRSTLHLFNCLQLPLFETYGLIESGPLSLNTRQERRLGSVGRLLPGVTVQITDGGEIIARRRHLLTSGYFQCAPGEAESTYIDRHSIATGDMGFIDQGKYLHLIGRKKEVIVTSGGLKVHPEVLEARLNACQDVQTSVVFPDEGMNRLVAVVRSKRPGDKDCHRRVHEFVTSLNDELNGAPIDVVLFTELEFSRENGFLRPNLKIDRKMIAHHFQSEAANPAKTR
jgi:long-chain acyl-CoA synthetase